MAPRRRRSQAPWTGPALLVPVEVQALGITSSSYDDAWSWTPARYNQLSTFKQVDPAPFTPQAPSYPGTKKFTGVVLHWALPDGLTRGTQGDDKISYPAIPNRWLVVRRSPAGATWGYAAWIVASDYLAGPAGSAWPNATATGGTTLGMSWPIDKWPGEQAVAQQCLKPPQPPLTATGAGDPTFAAFAPYVSNVLSFGDSLDGVAAGPLSYTVLGWYGDASLDPLLDWQTAPQWQQLMHQLGWSVGDTQDLADAVQAGQDWATGHGFTPDPSDPRQCYPSRTLCHGYVLEVPWQGPDALNVSGVPTANPDLPSYRKPEVALAHSGIDALCAMLGADELAAGMSPQDVTELLEVLQAFVNEDLATLDEPDGLVQLGLDVQDAWFDSTGGGTTWTVVEPRDPEQPSGIREDAPLDDDQSATLTALNVAQSRLDDCQRVLASWQYERYALWWKSKRLSMWVPPPPQKTDWQQLIDTATAAAEAEISALTVSYAWLRRTRDDALVGLQQRLSGKVLVADAGQPFRRPSDPVLVISGAGRGYKHGEDDRFSSDGTLFCRFTGQAVSGIAVTTPNGVVTLTDFPPPKLPLTDLPAETADLLVEGFFLDLTSAPLIAQAAATMSGTPDPWQLLAGIREEQSLVWNPALHPALDVRTLAEASGLVFQYALGALPSKVGVQVWSPPWYPLYVDWSFDYFPGDLDQSAALSHWDLPLGGGSTDPFDDFTYDWTGGSPSQQYRLGRTGRTFLTPEATDVLRAQVEKLILAFADDPAARSDLWALQDTLAYLRRADVLSQALNGFNLGMLERDPGLFALPSDHSLDRFLDPPGAPAFNPDSTPVPNLPGVVPPPFNPIRAGHMKLTQLWVVDAFGQVLKIIDPAGGSLPPTAAPVLGSDLTTASDPDLAELKPRITQWSRLQLTLLDATDDDVEVGVHAGANPVCGWLIPNHLDRSLLVYEADGTLAGELQKAQDRAIWFPAPDRFAPPYGGMPPVRIDDPHLRRIVEGILDRADSLTALRAMLDLVDTAFWSINPSGGWADEELPVLIGRPLAVVRARLTLSTQGLPAYSQDWSQTGAWSTAGFDSVRFPVQLGVTELLDDGLVGFYLDDDYRHIDTAYEITHPHPYVGADRPQVAVGDPAGALLTLVMDPSSTVHALSGVVPPVVTTLPGPHASPALSRMAVTFRTGPVLDAPGLAAMPLPALNGGTWSWLQYVDTEHPASQQPVAGTSTTATLPDPGPILREGWLKLVLGDAPTLFSYAVQPTTVPTTTDPANPATTNLVLTAYNGSDGAVTCSQLTFAVPVGLDAASLAADVSTVTASPGTGTTWTISGDDQGTFTATPQAGEEVVEAGSTLTFRLGGIRTNAVPGTVTLTVHEVTDANRQVDLYLAKVPPMPSTLLTYSADPVELTVGGQPTLTVTAYNGTSAAVYPTRIVLDVPIGSSASDLAADPTGLLVTAAGWTVTTDGAGGFTALPDDPATSIAPGGSLQLAVSGFTVAQPAGPVLLAVGETVGAKPASQVQPTTAGAALLVTKTASKEERP